MIPDKGAKPKYVVSLAYNKYTFYGVLCYYFYIIYALTWS
jgi:hypothetical protein